MITTALILCVYQRQRYPDMEKYILTFVRGSGSVWVHLSAILRVQVWFRFTEVKFCWFRFGSCSPKWNGSFGFTVRVQVRFDTLLEIDPNSGRASASETVYTVSIPGRVKPKILYPQLSCLTFSIKVSLKPWPCVIDKWASVSIKQCFSTGWEWVYRFGLGSLLNSIRYNCKKIDSTYFL